MEEVVDIGQTEPEMKHKAAAVFMIALAEVREDWIGGLPEAFREGEGVEAFGGRITKVLFQGAAVFTCPDLVQG